MNNAIFVDTSFFKALIDSKDEFHDKSQQIFSRLEKEKIFIVTSNYILDETFTLLKIKCGKDIVDKFRKYLSMSNRVFKVLRVTVSDEANAWQWFLKDWSKLSFTDCVSFAIMKRFELTRAATFDDHFESAGFVIEGY